MFGSFATGARAAPALPGTRQATGHSAETFCGAVVSRRAAPPGTAQRAPARCSAQHRAGGTARRAIGEPPAPCAAQHASTVPKVLYPTPQGSTCPPATWMQWWSTPAAQTSPAASRRWRRACCASTWPSRCRWDCGAGQVRAGPVSTLGQQGLARAFCTVILVACARHQSGQLFSCAAVARAATQPAPDSWAQRLSTWGSCGSAPPRPRRAPQRHLR